MNLLDIRDRIRDKAIDAGLTYTEIETLADTNELVNQVMPCLAWQYTGERGTIAEPNNELSLQVYLMTNYYDEIKVESEDYQRDWIVTQQNELREYFINWIKELNFESGVTYLEVISYEEIPIAEKLTINGLLSIEFKVNIQIDRGFCLDTESVEYLNQVKVYFNDVLRYTQAANVDLELTLKDQDGNDIDATFTGNNIVVNVGGGDCEDASYTLKDTSGTTLSSGTIASGASSNIVAPNASYLVKYENDSEIESGVIKSNASKIIVVPNPPPMKGAMPLQTGQTSIQAANDDAATQRGRLDGDFWTLKYLNGFGTHERFTDTLGGQTYADNIRIDWATWACDSDKVLGYCFSLYSSQTGTQTFVNWNVNAPYTCGAYSDWYVANNKEFNDVMNAESTNGFDLAPFNIAATSANRMYTSTSASSTTAVYGSQSSPVYGTIGKTNNLRAMLVRIMTFNGTTIT